MDKSAFHNAPEKNGFYVFSHNKIELFLAGHVIENSDFYAADIVGGTIWIHTEPKKRSMILNEYNECWFKINVSDYYKIIK